jgi:hypothetical protein
MHKLRALSLITHDATLHDLSLTGGGGGSQVTLFRDRLGRNCVEVGIVLRPEDGHT